jgi:hypothetical protein
MRRYSLPFKTLVGTEMVLGAWHYRIGSGDWLRAEAGVAGWDYLAQLEFHRDIEVDGLRARNACGLESETPVDIVVTAHCPAARFRQIVYRTLVPEGSWAGAMTFAIPSTEIAEQIRLDTEIILKGERPAAARLTARYPGSRLFSESIQLEIEGTRSRMPLESASFARQLSYLRAPRAHWYVDCGSGDLHAPVMRGLRVYLNSDQPGFAVAAQRGEQTILAMLKADIARNLLETALADDSFQAGNLDFGEGSLGEAAVRVLRLCFRDMKPSDVLALARRDPSRFQAIVVSQFNQHDD